MTKTKDTQEYELLDSDTLVSFTGVLLATASSKAAGKTRWSEISIYRTDSGKYIVHGVGKSTVRGEVDRSWCNVITSGAGVIERLTRKEDGVQFMPRIPNRAVAEAAAILDQEIHAAFYNHHVA